MNDPTFAGEVKRGAVEAITQGAGSQAWRDYFERFASTPGELDSLGVGDDAEACTCNSNTYLTLSSLVTPVPTCCATTTTTTTSGNYFGV
ncbi:MAG: hypothetical protein JO299_21215 [Gammaproteobacteria bacterium]|nr:hypothetical protein [Gammaproteobacteria bacterium]